MGAVGAAKTATTVAGLSGIAKFAAGSSLLAIANPEPVTKAVLAIIALISTSLGCYFVYRLVKILVKNKYKFKIRRTEPNGTVWEFEGQPA